MNEVKLYGGKSPHKVPKGEMTVLLSDYKELKAENERFKEALEEAYHTLKPTVKLLGEHTPNGEYETFNLIKELLNKNKKKETEK